MENLTHAEESPAIQIQQLQAGAQWWEELLHATGGRLELDKCLYYILQWKFDKEGKARLANLSEMQQYNNIVLRQSETQNDETITHRDCHNSHKTLGVMENPLGNNAGERERLQTKASKMAQLISAGSLTRLDASVLYRSVYLSSTGYSLPVTTLTEKELSKIQGAPVQALLSGMGYNRNMPKEVVFGSTRYGGIGIRHLYIEQWSTTSMVHSQSTMLWPKQGAPGPQTRATWRKFLQRYTTQKSIHQLHSSVGNWTNLTRRTWAAYYSATNNSIHVQHRTGSLQWNRYTVLKQHC